MLIRRKSFVEFAQFAFGELRALTCFNKQWNHSQSNMFMLELCSISVDFFYRFSFCLKIYLSLNGNWFRIFFRKKSFILCINFVCYVYREFDVCGIFFYNIHTGWIARTLTKCSLMCNWIFHSLTVWRVHAENLISHFFFSTEELRAQNTKIVKSNQTSGMLSASTAKPISVSHNLKIQHMTTVAT